MSDDEQANINALKTYEFIDYLSDQGDIPIDELVIRQMNREFLYGSPELLTPGTYRKGQNTVGNYRPPDQGDVPALMRSFALWLRSEDDLDPILKAGIAHIQFVAIHPFWDGNGRTARGLTTMVLQRPEFNFKKLLSLEAVIFSNRDQYFGSIEQTLGARYSEYDATSWLEFFTEILRMHTSALTGVLTDWHRMMRELYQDLRQDLNHRQVDGLMYATRTGIITRMEYMEITGASAQTASRDLSRMVELGVLTPEGKTRARVYRPAGVQREGTDENSHESAEQLRMPEVINPQE